MLRVKVTAKRQVTFPRKVCESIGIRAGDEIVLERRNLGDGEVWCLRSERRPERAWLGALRGYARGKEHGMDAVRDSIYRGLGSGK